MKEKMYRSEGWLKAANECYLTKVAIGNDACDIVLEFKFWQVTSHTSKNSKNIGTKILE